MSNLDTLETTLNSALANNTHAATNNALQQQARDYLNKQNTSQQSALPDFNSRFKWGFADDYGKQKILQQAGYDYSAWRQIISAG